MPVLPLVFQHDTRRDERGSHGLRPWESSEAVPLVN